MKYKKEDLDYIYIRSQKANGSWDNFTLNEVDDVQFVEWAKTRFGVDIRDDESAKGTPWTPTQKIDFLNDMTKRNGGNPVVCMINKSERGKFKLIKIKNY